MRGDRAPQVAWQAAMMDSATARLQVDLNSLGYTPPLSTDGLYGPATKEAVQWFQRLHGLHVDGVAGPVTSGKLELILAQTRPVPAAA
jgi:putative chitinase